MPFLSRINVHEFFTGRNGLPSWDSLQDPHATHCAVMRLFDEGGRENQGILYRVEPSVDRARPMAILIRSKVAPSFIPDGLRTIEEPATPGAGSTVAFRLAVNAVRRNSYINDRGKQSNRTSPVMRDDDPAAQGMDPMTHWIAAKMGGALCEVELINHKRTVTGSDRRGSSSKMSRIVQTDLVDGFASVVDTVALEGLLITGVGRTKAYGCGLLTVKAL